VGSGSETPQLLEAHQIQANGAISCVFLVGYAGVIGFFLPRTDGRDNKRDAYAGEGEAVLFCLLTKKLIQAPAKCVGVIHYSAC
jgi:hypothetical protein